MCLLRITKLTYSCPREADKGQFTPHFSHGETTVFLPTWPGVGGELLFSGTVSTKPRGQRHTHRKQTGVCFHTTLYGQSEKPESAVIGKERNQDENWPSRQEQPRN